MRPVAMGVSIGVGGVASGTTERYSRRCSEYRSSQGRRRPREEEWSREQLSDAQKSICWYVLSSVSGSLMRWDTCCDYGANKNPTSTDAPSAFSSDYLEKEGSELISPLW